MITPFIFKFSTHLSCTTQRSGYTMLWLGR